MKKFIVKHGFTLAEVLITLGIIGIIAAMTIPALINTINNMHYKSAYKKAFADFSQAFVDAIAENSLTPRISKMDVNATASEWAVIKANFSIATDCDTTAKLNTCWANGDKLYTNQPNTGTSFSFIDNSGRSWAEYSLSENLYLLDTNSLSPPNKFGKDRWIFTLRNSNNVRTSSGLPSKVSIYTGDDVIINDITVVDTNWCNYPPCYYKSWLYN